MTPDSEEETNSKSEGPYLWVRAPEGCFFRDCPLCGETFCFDGRINNCIWCEITKKGTLNDS